MIRKLQIKLILTSIVSLLLVLSVIIGVINIFNYRDIVRDADGVLQLLCSTQEHQRRENIKDTPHSPAATQQGVENWREAGGRFRSPELDFEIRWFSVFLENGAFASCNTQHIAAIDEATAGRYALQANACSADSGFLDGYRYLRASAENGVTRIFFLDCGRHLAGFYSVLWSSLLISLAGVAAVFCVILLLSRRIVRPFIDNYEKQRRFITDAGHELKTPLTVISADIDLAEEDCGPNEWLQDVRTQCARLSELTGSLIDLSRTEETAPLRRVEFPISELVSDRVLSFRWPLTAAGKTLETDIRPLLSCRGDPAAIERLVGILLDNTVKYAPHGTAVRVSLQKADRFLRLEVENNAEALTDEVLRDMFDRFYRGDASRSTPGHGIGLSIAKSIVESHRGSIRAAQPGKDRLRITVLLPV